MANPNSERPVYALPLFTWLVLLVATPIGVFLLWYHRHYNFVIRCLITLAIMPFFKINLLVSIVLIIMILLQLLGISYHELEQLFIAREELKNEGPNPKIYTADDLKGLSHDTIQGLLTEIFDNLGYRKYIRPTLFKGELYKKGSKVTGVLYFDQEPITKDVVARSSRLISDGICDHAILLTNDTITLYADEMSQKYPQLSLWTLEHVAMLLNHYPPSNDVVELNEEE